MKEKPYIRSISLKDGYDTSIYPFTIPAIATLKTIEFHQDVTFLIGENGTGKSTILEAIGLAMGFGAEAGTRNVRFETAETTSRLHDFLRVTKSFVRPRDGYFLRAESFYNVATFMDSLPEFLVTYGGRSLHQQSHGESFMATLVHKFRGNGLYILDEPEAALSPQRQLAALVRIHELVKAKSQFIIATHSPILMAYPSAKIIELDGTGWHEKEYESSEHYSITRDFLNNYRRRLEQLFSPD